MVFFPDRTVVPHTFPLLAGRIRTMDNPTETSILAAVLAFLTGGGAVAFFTAWFGRKKNNAEARLADANADKLIIGSALEFVNALKSEIVDMKKNMELMERRVEILDQHVRVQGAFISRLREALAIVKPDHPLLQEKVPILEL